MIRKFRTSALFAGIAGLELGLQESGHSTNLLCEIDPSARNVLSRHFITQKLQSDVLDLKRLPEDTTLVSAGFPCQDLSSVGNTKGITGKNSGLVREIFRLIKQNDVKNVLIENVPFMLKHRRGEGIAFVTEELEKLGYNWAYRVVDTRSFGLPQRRRRVFLFASKNLIPHKLIFKSSYPAPGLNVKTAQAYGFYWTEGNTGIGWAENAIPTLKSGSTIGIPSPPAIWVVGKSIGTPDIRDAERLQGFPIDWTKPAEEITSARSRWRLVGNAVSVPAGRWIGQAIASPEEPLERETFETKINEPWPESCYYFEGKRHRVAASEWPVEPKPLDLVDFLSYDLHPLSLRALNGFHSRLVKSRLNYSPEFLVALETALKQATPLIQ